MFWFAPMSNIESETVRVEVREIADMIFIAFYRDTAV